jgi:release factor glutamine methyltransferase
VTDTVGQALRQAEGQLADAGIDTPRRDAELLLGDVLSRPPGALRRMGGLELTPDQQARFAEAVRRRVAREPVQRILGHWEFWSLELELGPDTLIPRADTETVVDAVLRRLPDRQAPLRLLDLGTGTGALLLALLSELPQAWGVGTDISPGAAAVAQRNARRLGLGGRAAFVVADWAAPLSGTFDVVVSNPPYIAAGDLPGLQPEVRGHEPQRALVGGADGLDCYRILARAVPRLLRPGGLAALEHGDGQGPAVAGLLAGEGLDEGETAADLEGRLRVALARGRG